MLLTKIILDNIGIYKNINKFDFTTTIDKPVVLYGGINGVGKTTLFESITLCLYGQNFTKNKIIKKEYHEKIYRLFHHDVNTRISSSTAAITLEFQYAQNGKINEYRIIRTWQNNDGKINEFLKIYIKPIHVKKYSQINHDKSHLQQIINQIIPKIIADLFFFDGEKIQELTKYKNESTHIKSAFNNLLGLNISEQLHDDIGLYLLRNSNDTNDQMLADLEKIKQDKDTSQTKLEKIQEKRVLLKGEISRLHKILQLKEDKFFKFGGTFAQNRQKLINEKANIDKDIMQNELILRELIENNLPFAIISNEFKSVEKELQSDITRLKMTFEFDTFNETINYVSEKLKPIFASYSFKEQKKIFKQLDEIVDEKLKSMSNNQHMQFDFSLSDMKILQERIRVIQNTKYDPIRNNVSTHQLLLEKSKLLSTKLSIAPQQDEIGPIYSEIKDITLEIGEMEQELQTLIELEAQEKSLIILLNSKIRKYLSKKLVNQRGHRGLNMIPKIQNVLKDYSFKLREEKIKILESNILEGIQKCFHKDNLIVNISIDSETYEVTLYQKNGNEISKEKLSKGELQMYATAIIWGLAKTSERQLPFVIDTPLARLDEQHRENLVRNFYPNASHQTIIFSTDTEIIDSYYELLKPYVSQIGIIKYDKINNCSTMNHSYFKNGDDLIAI